MKKREVCGFRALIAGSVSGITAVLNSNGFGV